MKGYFSTPEAFKWSFVILHTHIYPVEKEKTEMRKSIFDQLVFFSHLAMLSDFSAQAGMHNGSEQPDAPASNDSLANELGSE